MPGLLTAAIVFGTVLAAELPDNSGLASLMLSTRYRAGGVLAGAAAAFAVHVVLAVTCGSLLGLLPHWIVQIAVAVVFLAGAVLVSPWPSWAGGDCSGSCRCGGSPAWPRWRWSSWPDSPCFKPCDKSGGEAPAVTASPPPSRRTGRSA